VGADPHRHLTALQSKTLAKLDALDQLAYVCALHEDGTQSMWLWNDVGPMATGKDAFAREMELAC
jgi:hypothetical protein